MKPAHPTAAAHETAITLPVRPLRRAHHPNARRTSVATRTPIRNKIRLRNRLESRYAIVAATKPLQTMLETFLFIPRILFLETQFGLMDLLFMVALLGNAIGLIFSLIGHPAAALALGIPIGLLVFNGATWGLWIATRLSETRVLQRWWLMLLGTLFPFAALGVPACGLVIVAYTQLEADHWPQILCGLVILPTCLCLIIEALLLQRQVQRQEEAGQTDTKLTEPGHA